ncbi:MAG: type II CRISPR-associated endonuclease Cas1 [Alphaproteobacteria bacterium]
MDKQILEIANDDMFLSIKRGFCVIANNDKKIAEIPLDNILSLIISSNNITISKNVINAITECDGVIIFCGKNYMPTSITLPYTSHWQNGERIRRQISASTPLQKSLCKTLIRKKIYNQALVLEWIKPESKKIERLKYLSKTVKSGDTTNNEAISAQIYFKELFGKDFVRNRNANDVNIFLNYTYIVLRACVARAIAGAGLLPALGIIHTNKLNPFTLVDDLIEPYRPLADFIVFETLKNLEKTSDLELTPEIKRNLAEITSLNLDNIKGQKTLSNSLFDTANSLAKSYNQKKNLLEIDNYIDDLIK